MSKKVFITNDAIGSGELGRILMGKFLFSLARNEEKPAVVMLANEGVRLACKGSPVLEDLHMLADAGVPVMACGTCLEHLGLEDDLVVGAVGTMPAAVESLLADGAVLTVA